MFMIDPFLTQTLKGDPNKIGPFMQRLRIEGGITQKDISDAIGFSVQTISKFENGRSNPNSIASRAIIHYILDELGLQTAEAIELFYQSEGGDDAKTFRIS